MMPDELRNRLMDIRWTVETMADALGCDVEVVEAWLDGSDPIPPKTKVWINFLAMAHREADQGRPTTIRGKKLKPRPAKG
jgi:hypothetical protein